MMFGTAPCFGSGLLKLLGSPGREPGDRPNDPPACAGGFLRGRAMPAGIAQCQLRPNRLLSYLPCRTGLPSMAPARECGRSRARLGNTRKRRGFSGVPVAASDRGRLCPLPAGVDRCWVQPGSTGRASMRQTSAKVATLASRLSADRRPLSDDDRKTSSRKSSAASAVSEAADGRRPGGRGTAHAAD